jgi:hypothetical protein
VIAACFARFAGVFGVAAPVGAWIAGVFGDFAAVGAAIAAVFGRLQVFEASLQWF